MDERELDYMNMSPEEFNNLTDEEIDKIRYENYKKGRKEWKITISLFIPIYIISLSYLILNDDYIDKKQIHHKLITSINNGATLQVIKNIYENREIVFIGSIKRLITSKSNYYRYETSLSQILFDIETNHYLEEKNIDINKTSRIISNYITINPFDSLETNQKDMFTDIKLKISKDNYKVIQNNLEKIASELTQKNNLVNEYLKDSTTSFWVSISALVFSFILGILQLWQSRVERQKDIIIEALKSHNNVEDNS